MKQLIRDFYRKFIKIKIISEMSELSMNVESPI